VSSAQKEYRSRRNGKEGAMTSGLVTNLVFVRAETGKAAELEGALRELAQQARGEPGNLVYEVHRSASESDEYLVFGIWRTRADLEAYIKAPAIHAFFREVPKFVDGAINLRLFRPVDIVRV
jgi:quinol monooxygenase YgiN